MLNIPINRYKKRIKEDTQQYPSSSSMGRSMLLLQPLTFLTWGTMMTTPNRCVVVAYTFPTHPLRHSRLSTPRASPASSLLLAAKRSPLYGKNRHQATLHDSDSNFRVEDMSSMQRLYNDNHEDNDEDKKDWNDDYRDEGQTYQVPWDMEEEDAEHGAISVEWSQEDATFASEEQKHGSSMRF